MPLVFDKTERTKTAQGVEENKNFIPMAETCTLLHFNDIYDLLSHVQLGVAAADAFRPVPMQKEREGT